MKKDKNNQVMEIRVKAGRPSAYKPTMIKAGEDYIAGCIYNKETPFIEEFALGIGVTDRTVYNWRVDPDKKEFAEVVEKMLVFQKLDLKRKALKGDYISKVATLLLSAEHDIVPVSRKELTGSGGRPIEVESHLNPEQEKKISEGITRLFEEINK